LIESRVVLQRTEIEQCWVNFEKAYRAKVRLKHSIAADNEINRTLRKVKIAFDKSVQQGVLPAPVDVIGALDA
jgi:hypothetical protein